MSGESVRVRGIDISRVSDGRIVETSVKYQAPELISADDAVQLLATWRLTRGAVNCRPGLPLTLEPVA